MTTRKSVQFFEAQFQRQARDEPFALNPFESLALQFLKGAVLDLGAGLGNLSLEAARRGHRVVAVDASPSAVGHLRAAAGRESLPVETIQADLATWRIDRTYDTIIAIGILMFFSRNTSLRLLQDIQDHVVPGGRAIVNVLIEGTTWLDPFDPQDHYLFAPDELEARFSTWTVLRVQHETFPAPGDTRKEFATLIAEKGAQAPRESASREN